MVYPVLQSKKRNNLMVIIEFNPYLDIGLILYISTSGKSKLWGKVLASIFPLTTCYWILIYKCLSQLHVFLLRFCNTFL